MCNTSIWTLKKEIMKDIKTGIGSLKSHMRHTYICYRQTQEPMYTYYTLTHFLSLKRVVPTLLQLQYQPALDWLPLVFHAGPKRCNSLVSLRFIIVSGLEG